MAMFLTLPFEYHVVSQDCHNPLRYVRCGLSHSTATRLVSLMSPGTLRSPHIRLPVSCDQTAVLAPRAHAVGAGGAIDPRHQHKYR
jgi:hypothetical protein